MNRCLDDIEAMLNTNNLKEGPLQVKFIGAKPIRTSLTFSCCMIWIHDRLTVPLAYILTFFLRIIRVSYAYDTRIWLIRVAYAQRMFRIFV